MINEGRPEHKKVDFAFDGGKNMKTIQITEQNRYNTGDIAKWIRQTLKAEHPDLKISVRTHYYSCGSSISLAIMKSRKIKILKDLQDIPESEINRMAVARNQTNDETLAWLKERLEKGHYNINKNWVDDDWGLTDKGKDKLKKVIDIANRYNYNNSDSMTDYFDVNYSLDISLGKWEVGFVDGG